MEKFGFSFDDHNIFELKNYEKFCNDYQELFHSMNLKKIEKTMSMEKFLENSKLENIIIKKPLEIVQYFAKIKFVCETDKTKKNVNVFLDIRENLEEKKEFDLIIDFFLKKKSYAHFQSYKEELVLVLEKEIKKIILKNFVEN